MTWVRQLLADPSTRGMDIDDPRTTDRRRAIVRRKRFLNRIYREWYATLAAALPPEPGPVVELGSGAGFMGEVVPGLITSEVFACPGVRVVLDGHRLPFADGALRGIAMVNVMHHLPEPRRFLAEAARCLRPGGVVAMVEPWASPWSTRVYQRTHHEPFRPDAATWEFPPAGPLSGANGALPWIIFHRDRPQFEREFPGLRVRSVTPIMPVRYLLSGGVSMRPLAPAWSYAAVRAAEAALTPVMPWVAMFARVELVRA